MKNLLAIIALVLVAALPAAAQNTLAGDLTVQKTVKFTGVVTPPALTANVNDYAPTSFSTATLVRVSSDAARTLTGLAGGASGRIVYLVNVGEYPLTFATESTSSSAANRFAFGVADYELIKGSAVGIWYDSTSSRWRPVNGLDTDQGGGTGTVQSVSVASANGVSGTVASPTINPVITLSLGNIAPTSVTATGTVTGSNLSGTNTGDMSNASTLLKIGESAGLPTWNGGAWPGGGGGSGSVTAVSVVSANGVSGTVANPNTTPAITLSLGDITPSSVAATGAVTGSNLSGTNTGDQTSVSGNAGTATKLQTARTINGVSFDGSANVTVPAAAGTLTGTALASNVVSSSLTSAAGGSFGTAAYTNSTAYDPAGAAAAITLSGLGGVPTTRTVNGHALSSNVTVTLSDVGGEAALGNPASNGYVLSSTTGGTRSWIAFPSAPVSSVFGRTGAVTAQAGDYTKSDVGLGNVENTALSTWTGSTVLTTLGTITTGTWHGTAVADTYIASASTWNGKQAAYTNLSAIGALADGSGWLKNNGAGVFSYSTPSKSDVGLGSVENTALSTWAGSANVTTLGTIGTGTWQGSAIGDAYIASASTWNAKQTAYTNLSSFGTLANASGWLKNNGTGTLSYSTPTKSDVGLGNVANVDTTNPANVTQSASYRFVTDTEKSTWNGKQDALGFTAVPNTRTVNGHALSADVTVTKSDVGLGSVENTALSTWTGSANVTTVGTIGTGTWNATAIADGKIASALTGKTYNGLTPTAQTTGFTVAGGTTSKTLTVSGDATINQSVATTSSPTFASAILTNGLYSIAGTFTDSPATVYHYGLGWADFSGGTIGSSAMLSGYGGVNIYTGGARRITVSNNGKVGIGTSSTLGTGAILNVANTGNAYGACFMVAPSSDPTYPAIDAWNVYEASNTYLLQFRTGSSGIGRGAITYNSSSGQVTYNTTSDYRAKVLTGKFVPGDIIDRVPVYIGHMKYAKQKMALFVAHEVQAVAPWAVSGEKDAMKDGKPLYQQLDKSGLVPILWAESQSLRKRVSYLEEKSNRDGEKIKQLHQMIEMLMERVEKLEAEPKLNLKQLPQFDHGVTVTTELLSAK